MLSQGNVALRGATAEFIEVEVEKLGIAEAQLVRPIDLSDVYELAQKDPSMWEPIEIRVWPPYWEKPAQEVLYHVVSGNHRTSAAKLKGLPTLRARVIDAPDEKSYLVAAIVSNTQHGKNFTREEYTVNAKKLQAQGLSLAEIAKILGYSKSAVSRMLTGNDSHLAQKQREVADLDVPTEVKPRESSNAIHMKVSLVAQAARMGGNAIDMRQYLTALSREQRQAIQTLIVDLQQGGL